MAAAPSGARMQQRQETDGTQQQLHTPSRFRTPERNLAQRGRAVAGALSTQHKYAADGGYTFTLLPEESPPLTPGVPGSARKRKNTVASSNATMAVADEAPARYSPDKVTDAIMSFADFLRFLEGNQKEHELMPMIIQRFSELGTVIESQKRHIDRWKQKELDLAICEAQQNLDLIRDLGMTIQQQELQLASWQVEKQSWEEKYTLAAQEAQGLNEKLELAARENQSLSERIQLAVRENEHLKREGTAEIQKLTSQVAQLSQVNADVEKAARERQSAIEVLEKENAARQSRVQQLEDERAAMHQDHERLGQQQGQQVAILQSFEQQISELKQACHTEQQRAASLERDLDAWKLKFHEQEQSMAELETVLENERRERGHQSGNLTQVAGEATRLQAQLEAAQQDYEEKLRQQQEHIATLEQSRREAMEQLQSASDKYGELLRESSKQHEAASAAAMRQLEENFLLEKNRLGEQLSQELGQLKHENETLRAELNSLNEISQRKSDEIERLMENQHQMELQSRDGRPEDSEAIRHLQEEMEKLGADYDELLREIQEKDELHQEDLRVQANEFETQYSDFVAQVEGQLTDASHEGDQLRAELQQERQRFDEQTRELQRQVEGLQKDVENKVQEATRLHLNEATQRQTIRSLYTEKEEMNRNMMSLTAEKANMELQLNTVVREKNQLQEEMARLDQEKRSLETKLHDLMKEATETLQTHQQNATLSSQDARAQLDKLNADIRQRDEQMSRGQQQLRELQGKIRALETRNRQLERDVESTNSWNVRLKAEVETLQSEKRALENIRLTDKNANLLDNQRALDDLTARYEQSKNELWNRVVEEENKVNELRAQLNAEDEYRHGQMQAGQAALDQLQEKYRDLEHENQFLNSEISAQRQLLEEAKRLEAQHNELLHVYEQLKIEMAGQSADNATTIAELEEHAANLQGTLEREQQLVQQLQSQSRGGLHQHAENAKTLQTLQHQIRELEQSNVSLRRQMQSADEQRVAKEQSAMHEKLQKEREMRSLQSRCEASEKEIVTLRHELAQKTQQNEEWERVLNERGGEVERAHRSAESEMKASLNKLEREFGARRRELESQIDELVRAKDAMNAEKEHLEAELHKADEELEALRDANEERLRELDAKDEEIERLKRAQKSSRDQDLNQREAGLESFQRELIQQVEKKDEIIEALHQVNQDQLDKLDDKDSELAALSRANSDHMRQLAAKDEELDAAKRESRRHAMELRRKETEVENLRMENEEQFTKLQSLEQRQARRSERLGEYERFESALEVKLVALQRKYDQVLERENGLMKEIATLKAEKLETKTAIKRELRTLNIADGTSGSLNARTTDGVIDNDLLHVFELARSYQAKQSRQEALIRTKEGQIAELSAQVKQLRTAVKAHVSEIRAKEQYAENGASELEREVERTSQEVARLKLENRRLREKSSSDSASRRIVDEWERNYPKLKARVQELIEENAALKEQQLSASGEEKHLVDEINALSALLKRKDTEIEELRLNESTRFNTSRSHGRNTATNSNSSTPRSGDARRMKDLMLLVQQKEQKIMVMNDHLTELMAQMVKLQFDNERLVLQFGKQSPHEKKPSPSSRGNPARVS